MRTGSLAWSTLPASVQYTASVVRKGVASCDHTCNNLMLYQMVEAILSIPGLVNPELVEHLELAIEPAARNDLDTKVGACFEVRIPLV